MFPLLNSTLGNHPINIHLFEDGCIAFSLNQTLEVLLISTKYLEVYINRLGIETLLT